jgi:hypothetical protein
VVNEPELARLDPGPAVYTPEVQAERRAFVRSKARAALVALVDAEHTDDSDELAALVADAERELLAAQCEILRAHMG